MEFDAPPNITQKNQEELSAPGLRVFFRIMEQWKLDPESQRNLLGSPDPETFREWREATKDSRIILEKETLERISYIVGIYKALHSLLQETADDWIHRPNTSPLFGGKPALDRMLSGDKQDLRVVRQYLDAQRGSLA